MNTLIDSLKLIKGQLYEKVQTYDGLYLYLTVTRKVYLRDEDMLYYVFSDPYSNVFSLREDEIIQVS